MAPRKSSPSARSSHISDGFLALVLDHLREVGGLTSKRMFGGVGLYSRGVFFGLVSKDELYLKVDEDSRAHYVARGCTPFKPYEGRPTVFKYYAVPLDVVESPLDLVCWARRAVQAAQQAPTSARRRR